MIKRTITYTDYDGNERTEDFYFNLTKAEIVKMENSIKGGLSSKIAQAVNEQDNVAFVEVFDNIILNSYGKKSTDGKRFIKSKEMAEEFMQTEAYSELFMELSSDMEKMGAFIQGVFPKVPGGMPSEEESKKMLGLGE